MQATLSDGTHALAVHLAIPSVPHGMTSLDGNVWLLGKGSTHISVRNSRTGEVTTKVELLEEGTGIATVNGRVWVVTASNKVFVFGPDGTLLGALQASALPNIQRFFVFDDRCLLSCGDGKDFVLWDTAQFCVERTFFGRVGGEKITDIVAGSSTLRTFIASTNATVRCWSQDGVCLAEVFEGAVALAAVLEQGADDKVCVWAAQSGWITLFVLSTNGKSCYFDKVRTLPCAGVQQLLLTSPTHICSFDNEGLTTLWDSAACKPVRTFKSTPVLGMGSGPSSYCRIAAETRSVVLWTTSGDKAMIWTDEHFAGTCDAELHARKDLEREEISFLRRKVKYMDSIATVYRQKVGLLFREKGLNAITTTSGTQHGMQASALIGAFNEIDQTFVKAQETWSSVNGNEPFPDIGGDPDPAGDFTEYWKHKYNESEVEVKRLQKENENLVALLHQQQLSPNELEVKRAHHICALIKEKNEAMDRERQLNDDIVRLRSKLREYNSPLGVTDPNTEEPAILREQNEALRQEVARLRAQVEKDVATIAAQDTAVKQNHLLKERVKKLRGELDKLQAKDCDDVAALQKDIAAMAETISTLQQQTEAQHQTTIETDRRRAEAELETVKCRADVDRYRNMMEVMQRNIEQRDAAEKAAQSDVRREIDMMCESLDDRDKRLMEVQKAFSEASLALKQRTADLASFQTRIEAKDTEIELLLGRVQHLESIVSDRKNYARTIAELQGRIEMTIEELRRSFAPGQFADSISQLEARVGGLFSLESQLRQKDDIIALKDDQIHQLQDHVQRTERKINEVSSVFMQLPKSVEEVEMLMVEVDEYRRRLGVDAEMQEMIQIRLLELQAKRKAGDKLPTHLDLTGEPSSRTIDNMNNLKTVSTALNAVAQSIVKEDKTGLIGTPRAGAAAAAPPMPLAVSPAPSQGQ